MLPGTCTSRPGAKTVETSDDWRSLVSEGDRIRICSTTFTITETPRAPKRIEIPNKPDKVIGKVKITPSWPKAFARGSFEAFRRTSAPGWTRRDKKSFGKIQMMLLGSGVLEEWDATLLCAVLVGCHESPLDLSERLNPEEYEHRVAAHADITRDDRLKFECGAICSLRDDCRNLLAHCSNTDSVSIDQLNDMFLCVERSVRILFPGQEGHWITKIKEMKTELVKEDNVDALRKRIREQHAARLAEEREGERPETVEVNSKAEAVQQPAEDGGTKIPTNSHIADTVVPDLMLSCSPSIPVAFAVLAVGVTLVIFRHRFMR